MGFQYVEEGLAPRSGDQFQGAAITRQELIDKDFGTFQTERREPAEHGCTHRLYLRAGLGRLVLDCADNSVVEGGLVGLQDVYTELYVQFVEVLRDQFLEIFLPVEMRPDIVLGVKPLGLGGLFKGGPERLRLRVFEGLIKKVQQYIQRVGSVALSDLEERFVDIDIPAEIDQEVEAAQVEEVFF